MALPPDTRNQLLAATREAAAAFVEDMPHIREVLKRTDPDKGEVRRMSNILRRLLVDKGGDLRDIAAPRIGKLTLRSPDNAPVLKHSRRATLPFFQSGGVSVFGVLFRANMVNEGPPPLELDGFNRDQTILLPMDNYLSQQVICLKGRWANRRDIIKYVANVASGVHSSHASKDIDLLLNRIRRAARYSAVPVPPGLGAAPGEMAASHTFNMDVLSDADLPVEYSATNFDPVLVELLAAAHFLSASPDINKLEALVKEELANTA